MANSSVQPNSAVDEKIDIFAQDAKNIWLEQGFKWLVRAFAIFVVIMFVWMVTIISKEAYPAIDRFGPGFLWNTELVTIERVSQNPESSTVGKVSDDAEFTTDDPESRNALECSALLQDLRELKTEPGQMLVLPKGVTLSEEQSISGECIQKTYDGALPYIYGTLLSSFLAIVIAIPVGLSIALVTSEDFLPDYVRSPVAFVIELIAAIPSVIIGLWAVYILIPLVIPLQTWLSQNFDTIPLFKTELPSGDNLLTAGIVLAIMILPTMAAISRDVLLVVPKQYRSGSMALGATRWETIFRVLLPTGFSGIVGATMLALGRALGETIAVTMVIGNVAQISTSLLEASYTIPAVLANEFAEADGLQVGVLTYLALILFFITLAVNIGAVVLVQVLNRNKK